MKVLHISAYYAPAFVYGGPPRTIHSLCRALCHHGVDVQVFTTDANGAETLPNEVTGCSTFEDVRVRYFPRSFPRSPIGSRELGAALRRDVRSYDLVHIHGLWNRVVWVAAREASRAGVPYVLSPRGMLERAALVHHRWRKQLAWVIADSRVIHGAGLLHATSESERETLVALRADAPVTLIPNGVELESRPHRAPTKPLIVFLGRLHPIKRVDLLLDAFAAARERHRDARLAIAGPDEYGLRSELAARAGRDAGAITWLGAIDAAGRRELLAHASTLVMCSDSESFGMSVLEAMAAAVPVVVTRTCPWSDVERYDTGYWIEQNAAAIADAIVRILDDPDRGRAMGERGRALVERSYQWDAIAHAFAAQYKDVRAFSSSAAVLPALS